MIVNIVYDEDMTNADIIDIPQRVFLDLENLQNQFFKWMFDKSNNHSYWVYENGEKKYCSYRSDAFIEWLNNYILNRCDEKAKVINKFVDIIDINNPIIEF